MEQLLVRAANNLIQLMNVDTDHLRRRCYYLALVELRAAARHLMPTVGITIPPSPDEVGE